MDSFVSTLKNGEQALCLVRGTIMFVDHHGFSSPLPRPLTLPYHWMCGTTIFRCQKSTKSQLELAIVDNVVLYNKPVGDASIRKWICLMFIAQAVAPDYKITLAAAEPPSGTLDKHVYRHCVDHRLGPKLFNECKDLLPIPSHKVVDKSFCDELAKHLREVDPTLCLSGMSYLLARETDDSKTPYAWVKHAKGDKGFLLFLTSVGSKTTAFLVSPKLDFYLVTIAVHRFWFDQTVFACTFDSKHLKVADFISSNGVRYDRHPAIRDIMVRTFVAQASKHSSWITEADKAVQEQPTVDDDSMDCWLPISSS